MSQSLNIIQNIIDENLIDAKTATQAYLNDILSESLKEKFEEVAPTVIGEEKKKKKGKKHSCANHVEHADWGTGTCISESHANPDENGHVAWYDVEFEHGVEQQVPTEDLNILGESMHEHAENPEDDTLSEKMDPVGKEDGDIDNDGDKDSSDKYLSKRRAAIGKAMKAKAK
tara:strand:- start:10323 stop:10838 length:516 start_codon:yes stop_codon:yes gene_type:complete